MSASILLINRSTHGFPGAGGAATGRRHTATGCLEEERNDVAPDEQPYDYARFDEETSFFAEMRGKSR